MIKKILLMLILLSMPILAQETSFSLTLFLEDGKLELENLELIDMEPPVYIEEENYELRAYVMSFKGAELYTFDLSLDTSATDGGPDLKRGYMNFLFPDFREAKEVVIKNKETQEIILVIDLSEYQFCNFDDFCDFDETIETCPEDCKEATKEVAIKTLEPTTEEAVETTKEATEEEIEKKSKSGTKLIIIIGIIVILIFIIALIIKKKAKPSV